MMKTIIVYQFGCSLASAITFAEVARVWWAGLQLINVEGEVTKESVSISAAKNAITLASSCKICFIPFTENGIHCPRMIKECGHTVCELCVDNLLKVRDYTSLECPFCRKVTDVNGPAEMLPKNFALLEQIEAVQKLFSLSD
ncbi:hypothetical protein CAEBREN_05452 [Caenorhabditis brenneri]|uniref:RING-type domain-containing protein n=1 Tax=Caenorhabditis brenneri TaxID=135651 RepID=G0MWU6_CAEBE|nr:hypothetical protein CAEBREN_05452 [Caenorhabditis brenneri]